MSPARGPLKPSDIEVAAGQQLDSLALFWFNERRGSGETDVDLRSRCMALYLKWRLDARTAKRAAERAEEIIAPTAGASGSGTDVGARLPMTPPLAGGLRSERNANVTK